MAYKKLLILVLTVNLIISPCFYAWPQTTLPVSEYLVAIQQRISTYLIYPQEAMENGWEGVAKVKFTLGQNGQIKQLGIAESSGYPLLDEAAISAVKKASPYPSLETYQDTQNLEITLPIRYKTEKAALKSPPQPAPAITQPTTIAPDKPALTKPKYQPSFTQPQELDQFIEMAIKNNQPTQIAKQEIDLADLKIKEAKRNLFPAVKIEGYDTDGEARRVEFEEREVKLQFDQPIYYGGRLRDTLDQSRVNLEITKRNYDREKIDIAHKAEVAYYNLVASRMNLRVQEAILQEAEQVLEIVKNQYAADLATPLEVSSAQSWYEQVGFQIDSTKHDMAMAELTFAQVLNIPEAPAISPNELRIQKLNLDLDECLQAGLNNRPELYLSELLVKYNQYGKKIEQSKNKFTVDLTTSYGYYEGNWKTEPTESSDTWYIGFKASKPWGGNTINTSGTTEHTGPHYGETDEMKARTLSFDFNLLNNLKRLSDEKKSDIELQRSLSDLNETTKTITFEIKDAFLNFQKALLQATTSETEAEFRQKEVDVLGIRAKVGELEYSNVLESLVNLSQAQTHYTQALANYFISLANLKKATGYGLKI